MATMYPPRLQDEIDRLFGEILAENAPLTETNAPAAARPQSSLLETWIAYIWQLALPGVDPHTLDIEVVARQVTVKGKVCLPVIESASSVWNTIMTGEFEEGFQVPEEVDGDAAEAQYERGILTIKLPKMAHLKPSSIRVQTVP